MRLELPEFVRRFVRRLRKAPTAYTIGPVLFVLAMLLLLASLGVETGVVDTAVAVGEAPPGIAEREVPFRVTPLFRASLLIDSCGIEFYLLDDSAYQAYQLNGALPPASLNCNRTETLVQTRVGHLVTNYTAPPGTANVTYLVDVAFLGPRTPYAVLSIPGAALAMGVTIWISMTVLARGTDRLLERARTEYGKRTKK